MGYGTMSACEAQGKVYRRGYKTKKGKTVKSTCAFPNHKSRKDKGTKRTGVVELRAHAKSIGINIRSKNGRLKPVAKLIKSIRNREGSPEY